MDAYITKFGWTSLTNSQPISTTDRGVFSYKDMHFGLKNAGATYRWIFNRMLIDQIWKTTEVYIDNMHVKSYKAYEHVRDLKKMFHPLWKYKMKLNPNKCAFGVESGKFLWFIVNHRGIQVNQKNIKTLLEMKTTRKAKGVQGLIGCVAGLSHFASKATNRCQPFFQALKGGNNFEWDKKYETAFQELKD